MTEQEQPKQSGLPPLEDIREEQTMRIYTITTDKFERIQVETTLMVSHPDKAPRPLVATVIMIDDDRVKEYMPSKVWATASPFDRPVFKVLYYINTSLPQAVKPFKDNTYLMYFIPDDDEVIEYDVNVRMFMDQVAVPGHGMVYVLMFGNESYDDIVVKDLD